MQNLQSVQMNLPEPPYESSVTAGTWAPHFGLDRIRTSATWVLATGEERAWLLRIWMEAWCSVPCGSMPKDPELFSRRIGCEVHFFEAHKRIFLRGWKLHKDGNLYHSHITGMVISMLAGRAKESKRQREFRNKNKNRS